MKSSEYEIDLKVAAIEDSFAIYAHENPELVELLSEKLDYPVAVISMPCAIIDNVGYECTSIDLIAKMNREKLIDIRSQYGERKAKEYYVAHIVNNIVYELELNNTTLDIFYSIELHPVVDLVPCYSIKLKGVFSENY